MAEKKKKNTGIGLAVWLIVAIIIVIIFLVKWETIHNNLIRAGVLQGTIIEKEEKPEEPKEEKKATEKKQQTITLKVQEEEKPVPKVETPKTENKPVEVKTEKKEEVPEKPEPAKEENKVVEKPVPKPEPKPAATSNIKLCFVVIDSDGSVNYKTIVRTITKSDSPLTEAINNLCSGPSFANTAEKNCTTLIPKGTKLLSASVKDGVAYLNFNDSFEFNSEGIEGYLAQLKQVINTATEFSSVNSVQFLINGQKKEYLGSDGVWIGTPLGKNSL